jgi:hypothetical protein
MAGKKKELCTLTPGKQWGGKRAPSPARSRWKSGKTKSIRIPEALADAVLAYAQKLDDGENPDEDRNILQKRLTRTEAKLSEINRLLLLLEQSRASVRTIPAAPTENRSVFAPILPQSWDSPPPPV